MIELKFSYNNFASTAIEAYLIRKTEGLQINETTGWFVLLLA